ncbi:MAG: hypothetical protein ACFFD2_16040 [Promethearchaeota archaeon]
MTLIETTMLLTGGVELSSASDDVQATTAVLDRSAHQGAHVQSILLELHREEDSGAH